MRAVPEERFTTVRRFRAPERSPSPPPVTDEMMGVSREVHFSIFGCATLGILLFGCLQWAHLTHPGIVPKMITELVSTPRCEITRVQLQNLMRRGRTLTGQIEGREKEQANKRCKHANSTDVKKKKQQQQHWCWSREAFKNVKKMHRPEKGLVMGLRKLMHNSTVLDVGSGACRFKPGRTKSAGKSGKVFKGIDRVHCVDVAGDIEEASEGQVDFADFARPQLTLDPRDWTLVLQLGAWIPPEKESVFIANLMRVSKKGIVIAWGKHSKITIPNPRKTNYIISQFEAEGLFAYSPEKSRQIRAQIKQDKYLRKNLLVFTRNAPFEAKPNCPTLAEVQQLREHVDILHQIAAREPVHEHNN